MVQFPQLHRDRGRETTLDTQADEGDISALATIKFHHFGLQLVLSIGGVLTIGDEDDCDGGVFGDIDESLLEEFEGCKDVCLATSVFFDVLVQIGMVLEFGILAESD